MNKGLGRATELDRDRAIKGCAGVIGELGLMAPKQVEDSVTRCPRLKELPKAP